jgi:hypothetical protein
MNFQQKYRKNLTELKKSERIDEALQFHQDSKIWQKAQSVASTLF